MRAGIPVFPGAFAIGVSFGVLARTEHFGALAAIVMSATTFAGSSQIAAVSLLGGDLVEPRGAERGHPMPP